MYQEGDPNGQAAYKKHLECRSRLRGKEEQLELSKSL